MYEYYSLIVQAVLRLENDTVTNREKLYEGARQALLARLDKHVPRLPQREIAAEVMALEAAIRKVAAEPIHIICSDSNLPQVTSKPQLPRITSKLPQITSMETLALEIPKIEAASLQITRPIGPRSVVPVGLGMVNPDVHRQRALMLRAIGTPRCLDLAAHHDQLARAIEGEDGYSRPQPDKPLREPRLAVIVKR
jgi:hypothetical protein